MREGALGADELVAVGAEHLQGYLVRAAHVLRGWRGAGGGRDALGREGLLHALFDPVHQEGRGQAVRVVLRQAGGGVTLRTREGLVLIDRVGEEEDALPTVVVVAWQEPRVFEFVVAHWTYDLLFEVPNGDYVFVGSHVFNFKSARDCLWAWLKPKCISCDAMINCS